MQIDNNIILKLENSKDSKQKYAYIATQWETPREIP